MRSSKSRSRSKQNRPRSLGNIINRVFDSSGPEGKVRGTPQQIIEKYQVLARDAQLSNDRVAAENFLQHAEHYTRMLAEAQREMAAEQEARQQQYQQNNGGNQGGNRDRDFRDNREGRENRWRDDRSQDPGAGDQPDLPPVIETAEDGGAELVETPEARSPEAAEAGRREDRPRRDDRGQGRGDRRDRRERGGPASARGEKPAQDSAGAQPAQALEQAGDRPSARKAEPGRVKSTEAKEPEAKAVDAKAPEAVAADTKPAAAKADDASAEAKPRRARSPKKPKAETAETAPSDGGSTSEAAE